MFGIQRRIGSLHMLARDITLLSHLVCQHFQEITELDHIAFYTHSAKTNVFHGRTVGA